MQLEIMKQVLDKIKQYDKIIIFRHFRPDGDAIGSTKGLREILRLSFPEKEIYLINNDSSEFLAFLGDEDAEVSDEFYSEALAIVLDTATAKRVSNQKFLQCREIVKIDHHIPVENYGHLNWVEEERSSACEMVACFYHTFREELKINSAAATYVYTGMVTDSGRFQYSSVSGDTLRYAAVMLDQGIDTDIIFANLYLREFDYLKFKAHVYKTMQITENGVAYVYLDMQTQKDFCLSSEDASACVGFMDSIKNCLCWIAFIENGDPDGSIRVRLRSRFQPINTVAEHFRGGGHACACGATVYNEEEMQALLAEADALTREYKATHEGWL